MSGKRNSCFHGLWWQQRKQYKRNIDKNILRDPQMHMYPLSKFHFNWSCRSGVRWGVGSFNPLRPLGQGVEHLGRARVKKDCNGRFCKKRRLAHFGTSVPWPFASLTLLSHNVESWSLQRSFLYVFKKPSVLSWDAKFEIFGSAKDHGKPVTKCMCNESVLFEGFVKNICEIHFMLFMGRYMQ